MSSSSKQRWLIIGLLISNAVLIAFLVLGHPSARKHSAPHEVVIERLDLNPAQVEAYQKLIDIHRAQATDFDAQINTLRLELYAGLSATAIDESTSLGRLAILQTEAEKARLDHFRAVKDICSSEQMPKFESLTAELGTIFSGARRKHGKRSGPK